VKILWYQRVYLDVLLDRSTWTGMVTALSPDNEVRLVTGYLRSRPDLGLGNQLRYIPSVRVPVLNLLSFAAVAAFRMPLEAQRFAADVVIVDPSLVVAALPAIVWARLRRTPRVFLMDVRSLPIKFGTFRDRLESAWFNLCVSVAGRTFDGITAITPLMAEAISPIANMPTSRMGLWSSGIDVELFTPEQRASDEASDRALRLLYHGALWTSRGLLEAIEAVAILRKQGEPVTLDLVGSGRDVDLLKRRVGELHLEDVVRVLPPIRPEQVPALIQAVDVGIVPFPDLECWRTSSPLKLIEYMTMSLPVVATPLPCNMAVAGRSESIVWAAGSDPASLASAVADARSRIGELRVSAVATRAAIAAEYSWEMQAGRLARYARSLLDAKARSLHGRSR